MSELHHQQMIYVNKAEKTPEGRNRNTTATEDNIKVYTSRQLKLPSFIPLYHGKATKSVKTIQLPDE